jgi:CubicO group peptidase (beta-lactamase class C family)
MHTPSVLLWLLAVASRGGAQVAGSCPLLGKAYPAATSPSNTKSMRDARESFSAILSESLRNGITDFGPLDNRSTTFSIAVFSSHEVHPLFEFHHLGENPAHPTLSGVLNKDTLYRVGSVTKVHAIYALLAKLGNKYWEEPVTKFVQELAVTRASRDTGVKWSEVTLGALASHLSGITRDCNYVLFLSS